jgi:hypothetical protein
MKHWIQLGLLLATLFVCQAAEAFTATLAAGTRSVYLRVGDGGYTGTANNNGTPRSVATVNMVSVAVAPTDVGNGVDQAMTSNATNNLSYYDNYAFCNLPQEVYIGGFFRRPNSSGASSATLSVTSPANLVDADGDTIPFSEISWLSTGNGDGAAVQPVPAGSFTGGAQTLATFPVNTWRESCHSFRYENSAIRASGNYTGRVTYTLAVP